MRRNALALVAVGLALVSCALCMRLALDVREIQAWRVELSQRIKLR